jgi:hypothetical protein
MSFVVIAQCFKYTVPIFLFGHCTAARNKLLWSYYYTVQAPIDGCHEVLDIAYIFSAGIGTL